MRKLLGLLVAAALVAALPPRTARAETPPSRWDLARDPHAGMRWAIHVKVRQLLYLDAQVEGRSVQTIALERARSLLEDADAAHSPDPRLRFDLGEVYEAQKRHQQAAEVLAPAVDAFPDRPGVEDALWSLSMAYAFLGRSREERATYLRLLPRIDEGLKVTVLLNLAEAEMHLGNMEESVARYREDIGAADDMPGSLSAYKTRVLAVWGLAVALDRSGDPQASAEETKRATEMDVGEAIITLDPDVFFVPAYERDWYLGLAQMVHAREAPSLREALDAWTRAVEYWNHYVTSADPGDRFVALARSHLARSRAERAKVQARVAREPAVKAPSPDLPGAIHVIP